MSNNVGLPQRTPALLLKRGCYVLQNGYADYACYHCVESIGDGPRVDGTEDVIVRHRGNACPPVHAKCLIELVQSQPRCTVCRQLLLEVRPNTSVGHNQRRKTEACRQELMARVRNRTFPEGSSSQATGTALSSPQITGQPSPSPQVAGLMPPTPRVTDPVPSWVQAAGLETTSSQVIDTTSLSSTRIEPPAAAPRSAQDLSTNMERLGLESQRAGLPAVSAASVDRASSPGIALSVVHSPLVDRTNSEVFPLLAIMMDRTNSVLEQLTSIETVHGTDISALLLASSAIDLQTLLVDIHGQQTTEEQLRTCMKYMEARNRVDLLARSTLATGGSSAPATAVHNGAPLQERGEDESRRPSSSRAPAATHDQHGPQSSAPRARAPGEDPVSDRSSHAAPRPAQTPRYAPSLGQRLSADPAAVYDEYSPPRRTARPAEYYEYDPPRRATRAPEYHEYGPPHRPPRYYREHGYAAPRQRAFAHQQPDAGLRYSDRYSSGAYSSGYYDPPDYYRR